MGCGGSKFDPEGKMIQSASIHPLLKRRILDQLRRRRREALKEDPTVNHSTKKLLRYKNNDANDHKDSNSSASNISFKLDHDNDAIATDEETPRTSSFVPSDYDSSDDDGNNNSKKNQQELLKPIYKEHHDVNNNDIKIDDDTTTTTAAAAPTTTTIRIAVATTTTTTTPALEGKFDHKHDDKNTIANNDDNHDDTFNLPVPLITENHAVIIYHQKAVDVAENKDKSAAPVAAAAAAEKDKDRDDEFLTAEEEAEEVVLVVVNEEEEDDPSYIYPGSPSFRVYCINSSIISDDEEEDSQDDNNQSKEDDATKKKTESDESGGTFESVNSNEGQESIAQTKNANWRRIRKLKKKIGRKGTGPVKVKQLLNVKACYNPATACSGGHDRARLLAAHKQAAVSS